MSDPSSSGFNLDVSGVVGFFGGDVSVSAMSTIHVYQWRRWLGWYNQPGSYEIAKRYGQLSRSRFWDTLYPGANVEPAALFGFDGTEGPKFTGTQSGTVLPKTTHVAHLFAEVCKDAVVARWKHPQPNTLSPSIPGFVTIAHLTHTPRLVETLWLERGMSSSVFASVAILVSLGACVGCALIGDQYCFIIILLGMVSNGLSCLVIATGTLKYKHPEPAAGAPPGDGVLESGSTGLVILKGHEGAVNAVTRGQFTIDYDSAPHYHDIGFCSILLTLQFLAQLLLMSQSTLHGQLLFLATLLCSWLYNLYLASQCRETTQRKILCDQVLKIQPSQFEKFELGTRPATVVFALLVLAPAKKQALDRVINDLCPNDTETWSFWKAEVLRCIDEDLQEGVDFQFRFNRPDDDQRDLLLEALYEDAVAAAETYYVYQRAHLSRRPATGRASTITGQSAESATRPKDA